MKKDIEIPKVEGVAIAVIMEKSDLGLPEWNTYFINLRDDDLVQVFVSSRGYGTEEGEKLETTEIRRFYEAIPAQSFLKVEPILEELFKLNNQYWVSFYLDGVMYDKKYIFLPESINEKNFIEVPLINKMGVMIK